MRIDLEPWSRPCLSGSVVYPELCTLEWFCGGSSVVHPWVTPQRIQGCPRLSGSVMNPGLSTLEWLCIGSRDLCQSLQDCISTGSLRGRLHVSVQSFWQLDGGGDQTSFSDLHRVPVERKALLASRTFFCAQHFSPWKWYSIVLIFGF